MSSKKKSKKYGAKKVLRNRKKAFSFNQLWQSAGTRSVWRLLFATGWLLALWNWLSPLVVQLLQKLHDQPVTALIFQFILEFIGWLRLVAEIVIRWGRRE